MAICGKMKIEIHMSYSGIKYQAHMLVRMARQRANLLRLHRSPKEQALKSESQEHTLTAAQASMMKGNESWMNMPEELKQISLFESRITECQRTTQKCIGWE